MEERETSRAAAALVARQKKSGATPEQLLLEVWLNDVLKPPKEAATAGDGVENRGGVASPVLGATNTRVRDAPFVPTGLQYFGLSRSELTRDGVPPPIVDRLYRCLYIYSSGFEEALCEILSRIVAVPTRVSLVRRAWAALLHIGEASIKTRVRAFNAERSLAEEKQRSAALQAEVARLNAILKEGGPQRAAQLQAQVDSLKLVLDKEKAAREHAVQKYVAEVTHRTEMQRQVLALRTSVLAHMEELDANRRALMQADVDKEELRTVIAGLREEVKSWIQKVEDVRVHTQQVVEASMAERLAIVTRERDEESHKYKAEVRAKGFLQADHHQRRELVRSLEEKIRVLQRDNKKRETSVANLQAEKEQINAEMAAAREAKEVADAEARRCGRELEEMHELIDRAAAYEKEYLENLERNESERRAAQDRIAWLEAELGSSRVESARLSEALRRDSAALADEKDACRALGVGFATMEILRRTTAAYLEASQAEFSSGRQRLASLEGELASVMLQLGDTKERLRKAEKEAAARTEHGTRLQQQLGKQEAVIDALNAQIRQKDQNLAHGTVSESRLLQELAQERETLQASRGEFEQLSLRLQAKSNDLFDAQAAIGRLEAEVAGLKAQAAKLREAEAATEKAREEAVLNGRLINGKLEAAMQTLNNLQAQYKKVKAEADSLRTQFHDADAALKDVRHEAATLRAKCDEGAKKHDKEAQRAEHRILDLKSQLEKAEATVTSLQHTLKELHYQQRMAGVVAATAKGELEKKLAAKSEECEELIVALREKSTALDKAEEQLGEKALFIHQSQSDLSHLETIKGQAEAASKFLREQLLEHKGELAALKKQLAKAEERHAELQRTLDGEKMRQLQEHTQLEKLYQVRMDKLTAERDQAVAARMLDIGIEEEAEVKRMLAEMAQREHAHTLELEKLAHAAAMREREVESEAAALKVAHAAALAEVTRELEAARAELARERAHHAGHAAHSHGDSYDKGGGGRDHGGRGGEPGGGGSGGDGGGGVGQVGGVEGGVYRGRQSDGGGPGEDRGGDQGEDGGHDPLGGREGGMDREQQPQADQEGVVDGGEEGGNPPGGQGGRRPGSRGQTERDGELGGRLAQDQDEARQFLPHGGEDTQVEPQPEEAGHAPRGHEIERLP
eukprot:jgi/Mesvir1/15843/Mv03391-RA.1